MIRSIVLEAREPRHIHPRIGGNLGHRSFRVLDPKTNSSIDQAAVTRQRFGVRSVEVVAGGVGRDPRDETGCVFAGRQPGLGKFRREIGIDLQIPDGCIAALDPHPKELRTILGQSRCEGRSHAYRGELICRNKRGACLFLSTLCGLLGSSRGVSGSAGRDRLPPRDRRGTSCSDKQRPVHEQHCDVHGGTLSGMSA